jgi:glycosyltransferase involved in cell wall biosynthesis
MSQKSVLVITLPFELGGVTAQNRIADGLLRRLGYDVSFAWRAPYNDYPRLSVPSWRAWRDRPGFKETTASGMRSFIVGSWLPEFEWAHFQPWQPWKQLLGNYQRHVVISGNILPAWGLHRLGLPSLNWVATPYWPDRADRFRSWPARRRIFDRLLNSAIAARQERELVRSTDSWSISEYTLRGLRALAPQNRVHGIIVIPVDTGRFHPTGRVATAPGATVRLCFSGRVSDRRKGLPLLVAAFAKVMARRPNVALHIYGDLPRDEFIARYDAGKIASHLHVAPPVPSSELPDVLRQSDIFVLPSYQEGLSQIAAEAMASGCCVVSTRCGGPEEFVLDRSTGLLADLDADSLAERLLEAVDDEALRQRLSANGVDLIRQRYAQSLFEEQFMAAFSKIYPAG